MHVVFLKNTAHDTKHNMAKCITNNAFLLTRLQVIPYDSEYCQLYYSIFCRTRVFVDNSLVSVVNDSIVDKL